MTYKSQENELEKQHFYFFINKFVASQVYHEYPSLADLYRESK